MSNRGSTPAPSLVPADLWDEIVEFIEDHVDVRDGDDGPLPNRAMTIMGRIDHTVSRFSAVTTPDNVGDSDRWQDPRDISGGETDSASSNEQSPTPRTDKWYAENRKTLDTTADAIFARDLGEHSRQLERELAEAVQDFREAQEDAARFFKIGLEWEKKAKALLSAIAKPDLLVSVARRFRDAFTYDPGHSDLDNEQPIHITVTLRDWRELNFALNRMPLPAAPQPEGKGICSRCGNEIDGVTELCPDGQKHSYR